MIPRIPPTAAHHVSVPKETHVESFCSVYSVFIHICPASLFYFPLLFALVLCEDVQPWWTADYLHFSEKIYPIPDYFDQSVMTKVKHND